MSKPLRYSFIPVDSCNMCGAPEDALKVLGKRLNRSQGRQPRKLTGITTTVVRCKACGLIQTNPQPVPVDIQDHYGVPPENYWKEAYFDVSETYFRGQIDTLKQLLTFTGGMKALDIGAGLGKAMIALERAGFDTYGFEPSKPFHERAIQRMGIPPDRLKLGMMEDMDYAANSFDFISFGAVLEHLYDPSACIQKAMHWLKPGGVIHIEVPSSDWFTSKVLNAYYRLIGTDYVTNLSPMHEPFHLYEFGLRSFTAHAERHGYELAHHVYYVCPTYLPKVLDPLLQPYMKWTKQGMQLAVWLRKN